MPTTTPRIRSRPSCCGCCRRRCAPRSASTPTATPPATSSRSPRRRRCARPWNATAERKPASTSIRSRTCTRRALKRTVFGGPQLNNAASEGTSWVPQRGICPRLWPCLERQLTDGHSHSVRYAARTSSGQRQKLPFAVDRDPTFGPLGTSPVVREASLTTKDYLAFAASGAACTSLVRTAVEGTPWLL